MKKSIISIKFSIRLLVMSLLLSSPILLADDTDIYLGAGNGGVTGDALVMLSLDYRANLTSTVCNGYDANTPGSECYFLVNHDGEDEPNKVDKVPTIYYELLGAVLRYVFWDADVSMGLMMNHQSDNNCVGPDAEDCSNGGFIVSGFDDGYSGDNDHSELFNKMASLPSPKGGASHPYQGKELFFEFFRYLTGQGIFNGHLGWVDFGTDDEYNLDAAVKLNVPRTAAVGEKVGNVLGITDASGTTILPDIIEEGDGWHDVTLFNNGGFKTVETYPFDDADDFSTYAFFEQPIASVGTAGESDTVKDATVSVLSWDSSAEIEIEDAENELYKSPLTDGADCSKVFTINFMDGVLNSEADSDADIMESKGNGGMPEVQLATDVDNNNNVVVFEEVLKYLYTTDFADNTWGTVDDLAGLNNVTSYFLVPNPNTTTNGWARAGGSGTAIQFDNGADPEELVNKLEGILSQILSVSTTFVSASVPVNVFNKAEFQDNLYIALFEANEGGNQRWVGNLKRLKLDLDNNIILDASSTPAPAFDANTGKLNNNIITYWTVPSDARLDTAIDDALADMDGRAVGRGGAGQKIPGFLSDTDVGDTGSTVRKLYTDNGSNALLALDASDPNASAWISDLGAADAAEAKKILRYMRGQDVNDIDGDNDFTEARAWLLGDPMHSRPFPVNYGALGSYSTDNHDIRILMASNDGFIRMFKNDPSGPTPDHTAADGGKEVWAYMPKEIFGVQKSLMNNTVGDHPYGIDGSIVVYTEDRNGNGTLNADDEDKVYAYVGMRRGGSSYFALNLSDPDAPELMWKISNTGVGGDFDQLGLTFAAPRIIRIRDGLNSPRLALAFSGGYNINKDVRDGSNPGTNDILYDADPDVDSDSSGTWYDTDGTTVLGDGTDNDRDPIGTALYIVDAGTGDLIWKAAYGGSTGYDAGDKAFYHSELLDSIPSTLTALDTVGDSITDRMYVGDTGGSIWRINLVGSTSQWGMHKFANLGRQETNTQANDRRFFHRPDFVKSRDIVSGAFDAVIVGSGDRANPKETAVQNHLYMLKDEDITSRVYSYTEPCDYIGRAAALTDANGDGSTDSLDLLEDIGNDVPNCPLDIGDLSDLTDNCIQDAGTSCTGVNNLTNNESKNESKNGWYLRLGEGEKSLSTPLTLGGFVLYTTYLPNTEVEVEDDEPLECGPAEGSGLLYVLDMHTAGAGIDFTSATHTYTDADGNEITVSKTIDDRTRSIGAGIPADVVPLGDNKVLLPGGTVLELPVKGTWSTFWYKKD